MRVAMSSESSKSCFLAEMGSRMVCAPFSAATSTTPTAFGSGATDPPRFNAPTTISPPFKLFSSRAPQNASRVGRPRDAPERSLSKARS